MASTHDWGDVADIPIDKPPTKAPLRAEIPSDDDMGFNDPQNVLYVNMEGKDIPARFKARIAELEQMLQLTHQLATIHAGIQVKQRKADGSLPNDDSEDSQWKRSQYRARVLETYFKDGVYSWHVQSTAMLKSVYTKA